jgi:hypothetical protein
MATIKAGPQLILDERHGIPWDKAEAGYWGHTVAEMESKGAYLGLTVLFGELYAVVECDFSVRAAPIDRVI